MSIFTGDAQTVCEQNWRTSHVHDIRKRALAQAQAYLVAPRLLMHVTGDELTKAASCAEIVYHALRSSDASCLAAQQIPFATFVSLALPSTCLPWYRYTCMRNIPADVSRCIATVTSAIAITGIWLQSNKWKAQRSDVNHAMMRLMQHKPLF